MGVRWITLVCLSLLWVSGIADDDSSITKRDSKSSGSGVERRGLPQQPMRYGHNQAPHYSPWATIPGTYGKEAYGGPLVSMGHSYNPHSVYLSYLSSPAFGDYKKRCVRSYGQPPKISENVLEDALKHGQIAADRFMAAEALEFRTGHYLNVSHHGSAGRHQLSGYLRRYEDMFRKEREAIEMEYATKYLYEVTALVPTIRLGKVPYSDKSCYSNYGRPGANDLKCDAHSKYRTVDGSCNNLRHTYWGKSFVCHLRLLPAKYDDGVSHPRTTSVTGAKLPGAREVSTIVLFPKTERSYYTHLKMQYGQYVNHDITNTPTSTPDYDGLLQCCPKSNHPQCFPISVPPNDYQAVRYNKHCLSFIRSAPCPLCTLGVRQQINSGTSFLDNSAVYGSTPTTNHRLRQFHGGLLRVGKDCYGNDIPPQTSRPYHDQCSTRDLKCFDSGDPRINQHPGIAWMHLIFVRLHNHNAMNLAKVNKHWKDEKLYQEARRLSVAQLQHVTYHEYLRIIFGPVFMEFYALETKHAGYSHYEPHTDPTTWNDYAAAACRFGHSQISSFFALIGYKPKHGHHYSLGPYYNTSMKGYFIRDYFFNTRLLHDGWFDAQTRGFLEQSAETVDPSITEDVHNYLYRDVHKEKSGGDLPANNVQRGRDHGLPPYYAYVEFCHGIKLRAWKDLELLIPKDQIYYLRKAYKHVMDIDLYAGGLSERHAVDADVGPTFGCILGVQYYHLKFGDRFFYTHGHQAGSFTLSQYFLLLKQILVMHLFLLSIEQLDNIRDTTSLSSLLCETSDHLQKVQKKGFFPPSDYNPYVPCKSFPGIDFNLWREKPHH
ncbi:Peroxidase-like protein [Leptotrombidium deliense]|uniref:Peroxidase-like protein n=1 Tax=Leptotrombidium deliense TaxID=299467 RepID=A0A443SNZ9_9ACAR|nr:Peroxidase-like protein [Leptotrombidium deliense]